MRSDCHFTKMKWVWLLTLLLSMCPGTGLARQVELRVAGDHPKLQDNAEAFVGEVDGRSADNLRRYAPTVMTQVREALRALGYYRPQISWQLADEGVDELPRLVLDIEPGEPVRVSERKVEIRGAAAEDAGFMAALPEHPAPGDVLDHGEYSDLRDAIQSRARRRGYFDGRFLSHILRVDPEAGTAEINLVYDSGERYRLGEVSFSEDHWFDIGLLKNYVTFEPGTPYHADKVAGLNRNLNNSGYFSSVDVDASPGRAVEGVIPVRVNLTRRPRRSVSAGIGFSTDVGPRFRGNWREHWSNTMGHTRGVDTELSQPRQNLSSWYELPLDPPMTDSIRLTGGYQKEDIESIESDLITLGQQWQHQLDNGWVQVVSLRWEGEKYDIGDDDQGRSSLLLPGLSYSRRRVDSPLDPAIGYQLQFDVTGSHRAALSDVDILHIHALAKGLITLADRHRFLARLELGGIATNRFDDVPPSLRFFTGGDQSVRGYAYETLSPEDDDGDAEGGRYLMVGSGEYQYQFADRWRAAVFVDHGNAVNDLFDPLATGAGFGLRWISPVGSLRLDLARGLNDGLGGGWRIHLSMGPEL